MTGSPARRPIWVLTSSAKLHPTTVRAMPGSYKAVTIEQIRAALPKEVPGGVASIVKNYFDRDPITFNTDWAGTMPMWGLTMWAKRGVPGALDYARAWFEAHLARDPK